MGQKMTEGGRFQDSGKRLVDYGGEYLIHCPKCDAPARISGGKLRCGSCGFAADKPDGDGINRSESGHYFEGIATKDWFGDVAARAKNGSTSTTRPTCHKCGAQFEGLGMRPRINASILPRTTRINCSRCGAENEFELTWHPFQPASEPRDPLFGCSLLLQKDLKQGTLYAFNKAHAEEYLAFIEAEQRERQPKNTGKKSFFTSLPAWIKSAKNRDDVAKALRHMATKASELD